MIRRFQEEIVWGSGKFRVDEQGRVWRGERRAENRAGEYLQVKVMIDGVRFYTCAHRLVWLALRGVIPKGQVINHINGKKDDNRPENLEVTSYSGNLLHAYRTGLADEHGQRNPSAKLTDNQVAQIRNIYSRGGFTMEHLGRIYGVRVQHISRLIRGLRRAKQGGPTTSRDLRHLTCDVDPVTKRFTGKKATSRLLDGKEWSQFPEVNGKYGTHGSNAA